MGYGRRVSDELAVLDATAQAELVRDGSIHPTELVRAAIERIERVDLTVNAVIHHLAEKALATTPADGPFRGVPFLVKDAVCHTEGDPYHCGMRFLKERAWREGSDTYLARRFRAAGFVFVGKTNTPELASTVTTEPLAYGPTRNPWAPDHSVGGSSGGSAAAVAAGLAPVAHANDMGGSIRVPASECGVVGLKPSRGRTSLGPDFGEYWGPLTHEGVLTRSVRDTAAVLDAVAGPMPGDPYTAPPPARPFAAEVGAEPGRLRVGLRTDAPSGTVPTHPECVAAAEHGARLIEGLGHHVELASPAALDEPGIDGFFPVFASAIARDLDRWSGRTGDAIGADDVEPWNWQLAETGRAVSGPAYLAAMETQHAFARRLAAWWADDGFDLLLTPTLGVPPPRIGELGPLAPLDQTLPLVMRVTQFLTPWNVSGQPAISLPLHEGADGLPIGVQLVAAYGREDLLLRVSAQLEAACPWGDRRPMVHA